MKCPLCPESTLVISQRDGVEIDYCPQCRGVWLDRGELEKIIERANRSQPSAALESRREASSSYHRRGSTKRGSWLSDLFD